MVKRSLIKFRRECLCRPTAVCVKPARVTKLTFDIHTCEIGCTPYLRVLIEPFIMGFGVDEEGAKEVRILMKVVPRERRPSCRRTISIGSLLNIVSEKNMVEFD